MSTLPGSSKSGRWGIQFGAFGEMVPGGLGCLRRVFFGAWFEGRKADNTRLWGCGCGAVVVGVGVGVGVVFFGGGVNRLGLRRSLSVSRRGAVCTTPPPLEPACKIPTPIRTM